MSEQRICKVQASVMIYSDQDRRWFHAGETGHGASTISILVNSENGNSRIVAQKMDNTREVTVNMNIMKGLKYHQATKTFHQWRDNRTVYGLNFGNEEQAEEFASVLLNILNHIKQQSTQDLSQNYNNNNDSMHSQQSMSYEQQTQVSTQNGYQTGHQNGHQNGQQNGIQNGTINGHQNGPQNGLQNGHTNGYQNGHQANIQNVNYNEQPPKYNQDGLSQQASQMNNNSSNSLTKTEQQINQISNQLATQKIEIQQTPPTAPAGPPVPPSGGPPPAPAPPPPPPAAGNMQKNSSSRPSMPQSLQEQLQRNNMANLKPASQRGAPEQPSPLNSTVKSKSIGGGGGNFLDELKRKQAAKNGISRESKDSVSSTPKNVAPVSKSGGLSGMERNSGTPTWKQQNINQNSKINANSASPSPSSGNLSGISQSALDKLKSDLRRELQDDFRRIIREELAAMNKY